MEVNAAWTLSGLNVVDFSLGSHCYKLMCDVCSNVCVMMCVQQCDHTWYCLVLLSEVQSLQRATGTQCFIFCGVAQRPLTLLGF